MKKIFNLNIRNIKGSPILTVVGTLAALSLPFVTEHLDAETVGGAVGIFLIGALAGFKKVDVKTEAQQAQETAKEYVEKIQEQKNEIKEAVKSVKK